MSKNKTVRNVFFTIFCLFACVSLGYAESCSSKGQIQYKTSGSCGTSSRTCCPNGSWSDWDGECPKSQMCDSFKGCTGNYVLKSNASEIEGNTVASCCSCNGVTLNGDCYAYLQKDYEEVGWFDVVYNFNVVRSSVTNITYTCHSDTCREFSYSCSSPVGKSLFVGGSGGLKLEGDKPAGYNAVWCGQDLGHPQGEEPVYKYSGGKKADVSAYPICDFSKSCYDICGKSGACKYQCLEYPNTPSQYDSTVRYYTSEWSDCPEVTGYACDDYVDSAYIYECSR